MLSFILRRLGVMLLTMLCLSFVVFFFVNLEPNLRKLAIFQTEMRATDQDLAELAAAQRLPRQFLCSLCALDRGRAEAAQHRPGDWAAGAALPILRRPGRTGVLGRPAGRFRMLDRVPDNGRQAAAGGALGDRRADVLGDDRHGSSGASHRSARRHARGIEARPVPFGRIHRVDARRLNTFQASFSRQSSPRGLGWLNGSAATAQTQGISFYNFTLPVMTLAIYGIGYIARMTRASMAEVMTAQYIRTARLKGLSFREVVMKHALRNALIAPFTVIMLQFPWLLTGVVIVEFDVQLQGLRLPARASLVQQRRRPRARLRPLLRDPRAYDAAHL